MTRLTLSFDNGPTIDTTPDVLKELQTRDLNAYFCVVGRQLRSSSDHVGIAKELLLNGHKVVNHSLTHGVALGDNLSADHAQSEIFEMHEAMSELLGDWGDNWFRPFGRGGQIGPHIFSPAASSVLEDLEYSVLMWNCVPRDWEDTRGWASTALQQVEAVSHAVLVLHDLPTGAMEQLPHFLDEIDRRGIEVTLELPDDCVPMSKGCISNSEKFSQLVATPYLVHDAC